MNALRKINHRHIILFLPLVAVLIGLLLMKLQDTVSVQSYMAIPLPQSLIGEYSYDGENWYTLDEDTHLSARNRDLYLRGHLEREIPENCRLYFYADHIATEVYVDGQLAGIDVILEVQKYGMEIQPSMCCREWKYHYFPNSVPTDALIEIHIQNPHRFGNRNAYNYFLDTICCTPNEPDFMDKTLQGNAYAYNVIGIILGIAGLLLLCSALVSVFLRFPLNITVVQTGLLAAFVGAFFLLDTIDICFTIEDHFVSTSCWHICIMYIVYLLRHTARDVLEGKRRKIANWVLSVCAVVDIGLILAAFAGFVLIYDTLGIWVLVQWASIPVLMILCVWELFSGSNRKQEELIIFLVLFISILLDSLDVVDRMDTRCVLTKGAVLLLFVLRLVQFVTSVLQNYKDSSRAKKLEKELEDSRIAMMLSQIQPHFIFNVLGTIRGLCRQDPDQAWRALGDFSAYLRANMNALTNTNLIPFGMELSHVEAYLRLEQMRMGDRLKVVYDIQEKVFAIPPLTLQPLVENAVKHGLFYKKEGGTVTIRSERSERGIVLTVQDDGIGFEAAAQAPDFLQRQHHGMENVRSRVEKMMSGSLRVESHPDRGSIVTLEFPVEDTQDRR